MIRAFSETPSDREILDSGEPEMVACPVCLDGEVYDEPIGAACWGCHGSGEVTEQEAKSLLATRRAEQQEHKGD
jgi:hypothetical protein